MISSSLSRAVQTLERIAPPRLAGKWDNVGLLIDHAIPIMDAAKPFKVLLTNDLTLHVVHEAIEKNISLIVTYHPTPFSALKKFPFSSASSPMASKVVLLCARHDIAVYSPHTSWDNVKPGLNDWLLEGICNEALKKINSSGVCDNTYPLSPSENQEDRKLGFGEGRIWEVPDMTTTGGPLSMISLLNVVDSLKNFLNLPKVQVALPSGDPSLRNVESRILGADSVLQTCSKISILSVSVCAGAGASLLPKVIDASRAMLQKRGERNDGTEKVDDAIELCHVYITGEMSHHDVLSATQAGVAVILTGHTNCERGFLAPFAKVLQSRFTSENPPLSAEVYVSTVDADPLTIV